MADIKDKIAKLLALAESPNEAEAKAALLKARELMAKQAHPGGVQGTEEPEARQGLHRHPVYSHDEPLGGLPLGGDRR